MSECKIVRDLWPLYLDGMLSEESERFISGHLQACATCRELRAKVRQTDFKQALAEPDLSPGGAEKFLQKLKRRLQLSAAVAVAAVLVLILIVLSVYTLKEEHQSRKQTEAERSFIEAQLATLYEVSPPAEPILEELGVDYNFTFRVTGAGLPQVTYFFSWPDDSPVTSLMWGSHWPHADAVITDADTGKEILRGTGSFSSSANSARGGFTSGEAVEAGTLRVRTQPFYAFLIPDERYSCQFSYRGGEETITVDEKLIIRGVEFQIKMLVFTEKEFTVIYRQLTPAAEVGFYQLSFFLDDGLGNRWDDWFRISINIADPREHKFSYIHDLSDSWSLSVSYLVRVIPGFEGEISLEEAQ